MFDFLSLGKDAHEREVEKGLVSHIERFLLELGEGFAFLGRQYHVQAEDKDFYIDLLFYHIKLRAFVVIELKSGEFKPEYAGKMNFYLSLVDDVLRQPGDNSSIGLAEYKLEESLPENVKTMLPSIEEIEKELSKELKEKG